MFRGYVRPYYIANNMPNEYYIYREYTTAKIVYTIF